VNPEDRHLAPGASGQLVLGFTNLEWQFLCNCRPRTGFDAGATVPAGALIANLSLAVIPAPPEQAGTNILAQSRVAASTTITFLFVDPYHRFFTFCRTDCLPVEWRQTNTLAKRVILFAHTAASMSVENS
jgi:hypothetical protein